MPFELLDMTENTGFACYVMFNALKLHFTTESYDYIKYSGKSNVNRQSFLNNKSKYSFYKLSRKYSTEELKGYFISQFIDRDVKWIGDITDIDSHEVYINWKKRNESLTYRFETDIDHLFGKYKSVQLLSVIDQYPALLSELMEGSICIETVTIMNKLMEFLPMWKRKIQDDIIWPSWCIKIDKYTPFVIFNEIGIINTKKQFIAVLRIYFCIANQRSI